MKKMLQQLSNLSPSRRMTEAELAEFGLNELAYIKPLKVQGEWMHGVYGADGTPITIIQNRELAIATLQQHEMAALSVH
ncbi:MAG: DUF1150 family protein [Alphaproteobacteria bacterium]|nr:DUF1150 family protein [Alphaproteobacteria bacterium]NDC55909.1 DUF1150 family protein [Alphaproteobacteria bacterium]NDG03896.1 DUF1150 family protein [Alphaproteobacteria bacterium]